MKTLLRQGPEANGHGRAPGAPTVEPERRMPSLSTSELYDRLESSSNGLTEQQAAERLRRVGPNEIQRIRKTPLFIRLLANFTSFFAILLWIAGGLSFLTGSTELGIAIIAVIIINGIFSFLQEYKAEKATEALLKLVPLQARVLREGEERRILAREVVPGDIIILSEGDRVSADARLIQAFDLRVDQATLTGESLPVRKIAEPVLEEMSIIEAPNLVFAGTNIATGTARGITFATSMQTEFGKVAGLTQAVESGPSPLQRQISRVSKTIGALAVSIGILFFASGLAVGLPPSEGFVFAIGIIAAMVPEGLLPTLTLALAVGVQRMARRHALVKKLSAVETLGSTTVIGTDKTGTLTQNEMTVRDVWEADHAFEVTGVGYDPTGWYREDGTTATLSGHPALKATLRSATFANNARLLPPQDGTGWKILGDPTEGALLVAARKIGFDYQREESASLRLFELPFDSLRKRMTAIYQENRSRIAYVKGAPKEVLDLCTRILTDSGERTLTAEERSRVMGANDGYARQGLRVLAMASRPLPDLEGRYTVENVERDLTFLGLMAMMDPPRPEVATSVHLAQSAGVRIIMVTGDYGLTAESIARRIGIVTSPRPQIVSGTQVDEMTDADLQSTLSQEGEIIFARVAPEHKLRIVSALKALNETVAVTGDGVNDAPALKRADIGVAMGITGTDVAKESAEVILTDDNFATIVAAIEQGRAVYDNIKKFITYIFASNVAELVPFLFFALLGIPLPLPVLLLLSVDLGTDLLPALALGTEGPEPGIMDRPPEVQRRPILNLRLLARAYGFLGLIVATAGMSSFFWVYLTNGWRPGQPLADSGPIYQLATTMTFAGIVAAQVGNSSAVRTERVSVFRIGLLSNRLLLLGIALEVTLLASISYLPFLQAIYHTAPLRLVDILFLLIWPPTIFLAEEARKFILRRRSRVHEEPRIPSSEGRKVE